jgi:hypothetical protein
MTRTDRTAHIAASVARAAGAPALAGTLADLGGSALGSLLLEVFRRRARRATAAAVAREAAAPLFRASVADGRLLHRFDAAALDAASGFDAVDVSPVAPLAACAALSGVDQNNVLTGLRRAEVLADPTVALALTAAQRRRAAAARRGSPTRLCTSARLVRTQSLEGAPETFTPHFRLFALVTAGRDTGEHRLETEALADHVLAWLRLVARLREEGFRVGEAAVEISDVEAVAALCAAHGVDADEIRDVAAAHRVGAAAEVVARRGVILPSAVDDPRRDLGALHARLPLAAALRLDRVRERVLPAIAARFPGTALRIDLSRLEGLGYYAGLALRIRVDGPAGSLPLIDGGFVPWTQALLADRKERLLASAIGSELVCKVYAPTRNVSGAPT